jgi:hypothetical protein
MRSRWVNISSYGRERAPRAAQPKEARTVAMPTRC